MAAPCRARSVAPRMVQYLTYLPEHCQDHDAWI
jgi:hypothetical protein